MKLTTYNSYKDSGEEWLGTVPAHWKVVPNRGTFTEVDDKNHPDEEMLSVTIGQGVIRQSTLLQDESMKDGSRIDKSSYKMVQPGDIAYNKMRAWQGALGASKYKGIISPAYVVQRPAHGNDVEFLQYLLRTPAFAKEAERWSYGIASDMWSLRPEHFKAIHCCIPPPDEQAAIVRFLDHADEQIQRYIAAKERLIALLEEQQQALVHQAVTRGLDPNVRLKLSGVEWVGNVPEHWETVRLGSIGRFSKGNGGTKEDEVPAGVPCIRYGDIYTSHKYFINASRAYIKPEKTSEYTPLRFGDILFAGSGETIEEIGKSAVNLIDGPAYSGGDVIIFRPTIRLNAEFTGYATDSPATQAQKSIMGRGFTVMHIYGNQLKNIQIALPPIGEQDGIVEHINNGTALIDDTIARSHRQINLMNEYRTRLIADVVTGQLDVREAAAQLPAAP